MGDDQKNKMQDSDQTTDSTQPVALNDAKKESEGADTKTDYPAIPNDLSEGSQDEDDSKTEPADPSATPQDDKLEESSKEDETPSERKPVIASTEDPNAKWYVVHIFAGHENKVLTNLKQRVESEHLENRIFDILVPTQDKIEIRAGKKETVKEKIFPGYILVKMILDDNSWLTVRTTQGVTSFIGAGNKPIPISEAEVNSIVKFTTQGAAPTFKDVFMVDDTVKIVDGPFSDFIGKVESVDKEKGRVRVLVSIFGRETPVELDFLQVQKL